MMVLLKRDAMNWSDNTGKGTMRGMEAPIVLTGMYPITLERILQS